MDTISFIDKILKFKRKCQHCSSDDADVHYYRVNVILIAKQYKQT